MSDINEVITHSINRAFNAGVETGIIKEQNRILEIAHKITFENWKGHDLISLQDLIEEVKGENPGR